MATKTRRNVSITRFFQDLVDDTKGFVDDLLDTAGDVERNVRDSARDAYEADDGPPSSNELREVRSAIAELAAQVDRLAAAQRKAVRHELESMTKAELQQYADEKALAGVDQNAQTKDEMLAAVRRQLH